MFFLKLDNIKYALPTKHAKHFEKNGLNWPMPN